MHGRPASAARHNYRFTIGEQECAEHQPARPELVPSASVAITAAFVAEGNCGEPVGEPCRVLLSRRRAVV
jgi:hypothetical protein